MRNLTEQDEAAMFAAIGDAFRGTDEALNKQCRIILDDIEALTLEAETCKDWRRVKVIGQTVRMKFERLAQIVKEASHDR